MEGHNENVLEDGAVGKGQPFEYYETKKDFSYYATYVYARL